MTSSRSVENETAMRWPELDKEAKVLCKTCHGWQVGRGKLATWLRCLQDPSKKLRFISWVHRLLETTFSLWLTITVDTWKLVFWQETQLKWPSGAYRRCLQSMDFPILWQAILVPIFVAESFETFLMDNGIKHRKTTPLWPRPMVRLKAKKRSLLKRMLKAQVEGKNWKEAVMKCLVASRNTPYQVQVCYQSCCLKGSWTQNFPV